MPSDTDRPAETIAETSQRGENAEGTQGENVDTAKRQRSFGGLSPSEAGKRSAARRAERSQAQDAEALATSTGKIVLVRVPVHVGDIMSKLGLEAKKGNTQAARELREWMRENPAEDETDISALDRRTRQDVMARVLADIEQTEGARPDGPLS